jgi:myo-inositol-hexaphosphate 3-phosphohydrolase
LNYAGIVIVFYVAYFLKKQGESAKMRKTLKKEKFKAIYMSFPYFILTTFLSLFHNPTYAQVVPQCELPQFGVVYVNPDTETLMFVTAKDNHLVEVWKYPIEGNELTPLRHSTFNSGQVNGVIVDQQADLLYVSIGSSSSTVSVFSLPDLNFVTNFNKSGADYYSEPNLTLLNLSNGNKNVYVSADYTVYIHDAVTGDYIDEFVPTRGLETMAPDNYYQRLYIPDENGRTGVYVYNSDGSPYTESGSSVFGTSQFNADAEGIIVYNCPMNNPVDQGQGFIVVSDQRSSQTDFEFFDRVTWEHLGTLRISGVSNTDGIASYPYSLPDYPVGVFAAINNDHSVAIVGWDKIFEEILATTDVKDMNSIPQNFELYQNYPNPFNPTTRIKYSLPYVAASSSLRKTLTVYDVLGNEVATFENEQKSTGDFEVEFNGEGITSGIYFYQLKVGEFTQTKRMVMLK